MNAGIGVLEICFPASVSCAAVALTYVLGILTLLIKENLVILATLLSKLGRSLLAGSAERQEEKVLLDVHFSEEAIIISKFDYGKQFTRDGKCPA